MTNPSTDVPTYPAARIAGEARSGTPHPVVDPATEDAIANVGWATAADVDDAVRAALAAAPGWAGTSARERAAALRAIAEDLRTEADRLGDLTCAETGKRMAEARGEALFSAMYFDWFAEAATMDVGEYRVLAERRFLVRRQPVGVVAALTPWNFPISIPARKIAPALAAGCPVVLKPSELTPLSGVALIEICERHLPTGVVGLVVGDGAELSNALVEHPGVAAVSFTGSTRVGALVGQRAARDVTRVTLELGGKAPFVVCEDADLDTAVETLLVAKFRNNGASCIAANNVLVHADVYADMLERFTARVQALRVGDPRDSGTELGPLLRRPHVERLRKHIEQAESAGARVWAGDQLPARGYFLVPTVVEALPDRVVPLWDEEVFGPVAVVRPYQDEAALVDEVNEWRQGLGGYVVSADTEHALRLAERLRIGIVGVNNGAPNTPEVPFGGFGLSGLGREGGRSGLAEFTEEQTISLGR